MISIPKDFTGPIRPLFKCAGAIAPGQMVKVTRNVRVWIGLDGQVHQVILHGEPEYIIEPLSDLAALEREHPSRRNTR